MKFSAGVSPKFVATYENIGRNIPGGSARLRGGGRASARYKRLQNVNGRSDVLFANNNMDSSHPGSTAYFPPQPVNVYFTAKLETEGAPIPDGRFTFQLDDLEHDLHAEASNDANGDIVFPGVLLTKGGMYDFIVRQLQLDGNGWTTDVSTFRINFFATDHGNGSVLTLGEPQYPDGLPVFYNVYSIAPTDVTVTALLTVEGAPLPDGRFEFGLYGENNELLSSARSDDLISSARNDQNGDITFPDVTLDAEGTYHFFVRQLTPSDSEWTTDATTYPVDFNASDDGAGALQIIASYPNGQPIFNNVYSIAPTDTTVTAIVTVTGAQLPNGRFEFGLYNEDDELISSARNDASGDVAFPDVILDTVGVHRFFVRQLTPSDDEWLVDGSSYRIDITVYDDGSGTMQTAQDYPDGPPVFDNVYRAWQAATVSATLKICGYNPPPATFSFGLYNEAGQLVAETDMSGSGEIALGPVEFDTPGRYSFRIRQISSSIPGWTLDSRIRTATVIVTEREGVLQARMRPDMLVFVNKYGSCPGIA